ncbi:MAG TPA: hypothetical protein PLR25_11220, partial [Planctomycetaceae bacterium]|nr:hypothetical protein [Planctomycetaceae bacterium]
MKIFGKDAPKSKPQRSTHGEQLAKALNWIITDDMFAEVALHGNIYSAWPRMMPCREFGFES